MSYRKYRDGLEDRMWIQSNGVPISIDDMDDGHIYNTVKLLESKSERRIPEDERCLYVDWINALQDELEFCREVDPLSEGKWYLCKQKVMRGHEEDWREVVLKYTKDSEEAYYNPTKFNGPGSDIKVVAGMTIVRGDIW